MATKTKSSSKAKPATKAKIVAPAAKTKKASTAQPVKKTAPAKNCRQCRNESATSEACRQDKEANVEDLD